VNSAIKLSEFVSDGTDCVQSTNARLFGLVSHAIIHPTKEGRRVAAGSDAGVANTAYDLRRKASDS
jgi:hypothetical protein